MPRDIEEFKGDCLIVGGGWSIQHQKNNQCSIRNPNNFYTLDNDRNALPDFIFDFECAAVRDVLPPKRFKFIYFEHFPYIEQSITLNCFINAKQLLKDNGVLIYIGGTRPTDLKIPELLSSAGFKYIVCREVLGKFKDFGSVCVAANNVVPTLSNLKKDDEVINTYIKHFEHQYPEFHIIENNEMPANPMTTCCIEVKHDIGDFKQGFFFNAYYSVNNKKTVAPPHVNNFKIII